MRLNVYAEEIRPYDCEVVTKEVQTNAGTIETFYGVRMYLESTPALHHSLNDDDRSAITFWVRWTRKSGNNPSELMSLFNSMFNRVTDIRYLINTSDNRARPV